MFRQLRLYCSFLLSFIKKVSTKLCDCACKVHEEHHRALSYSYMSFSWNFLYFILFLLYLIWFFFPLLSLLLHHSNQSTGRLIQSTLKAKPIFLENCGVKLVWTHLTISLGSSWIWLCRRKKIFSALGCTYIQHEKLAANICQNCTDLALILASHFYSIVYFMRMYLNLTYYFL